MFCIRHARVFTPDEVIEDGAVLVENGRISAVGPTPAVECPPAAEVVDAHGRFLVPGFIDLQVNGGFGYDFTTAPETIWSVAAQLPRSGVTAFLPTIITSPLETVRRAQAVLGAGPPVGFRGAQPLGLHLEGPFLNPARRGAHNPAYLRRPAPPDVVNWSPETAVVLVTLAPELPGALEVVGTLTGRGVVVSAGHSLATFAQAQTAFAAGVRGGTHLFNAMPPLHHREPGLAGALLSDSRVIVGLIADGIHVHPAWVRLVWEMVGNGRVALVTDAMAALGMRPGTYRLGDRDVAVDATCARLADGMLAGSIITLDAALRNVLSFTALGLEAVLPALTTTPAALLGLPRKGRIAPGFDADLVLLSEALEVEASWNQASKASDNLCGENNGRHHDNQSISGNS